MSLVSSLRIRLVALATLSLPVACADEETRMTGPALSNDQAASGAGTGGEAAGGVSGGSRRGGVSGADLARGGSGGGADSKGGAGAHRNGGAGAGSNGGADVGGEGGAGAGGEGGVVAGGEGGEGGEAGLAGAGGVGPAGASGVSGIGGSSSGEASHSGQSGTTQGGGAGQAGEASAGAGQSGQGEAGQGAAGQGEAQSGASGEGGESGQSGQSGQGQGGQEAGGAGQGGQSEGGQGGQAGAGAGAGMSDQEECEVLHPDVTNLGMGPPGAKARQVCYAPSAEEMTVGCLPASAPQLKEQGYLRKVTDTANIQILSVQSEATVYTNPCEALSVCCLKLPPLVSELMSCEPMALLGDMEKCLMVHSLKETCGEFLPSMPQPGEPHVCCYKTCAINHSAGRPVVVGGVMRVASAVHRSDW